MNEEVYRNKIYVSSPTSISIGNNTWFALDTKLVGRIKKLINDCEKKDKEIERLNNELVNLQNRFDNLMEAHKICDEDNERLNNIIDKLESYLEHQYLEWKDCETDVRFMAQEDKAILNRLKELKEGK